MGFHARFLARLSMSLLFLAALSSTAFAGSSHERSQFGHDITIGPNEESGEITCFGCSVRIRGRVTSDVTTFGGSVVLEDNAEVGGDVSSFGGDVRLEGPVKINGDLSVFGGRIRRDASATIGGDITNFSGGLWVLLIFGLPLVFLGAFIALVVWLVRLAVRPRVPATA